MHSAAADFDFALTLAGAAAEGMLHRGFTDAR
jgi:hypothetical protein